MPVRLLDPVSRQSASFVTSFNVNVRLEDFGQGDGMTFVMSERNNQLGSVGRDLGIFTNGTTSFKTIVVEFDTYQNLKAPFNDINDSHVGFNFRNVTFSPAVNSSNVSLWNTNGFHAWVEYSNETRRLEVRVNYGDSRPIDPLLNRTVNMFDVAAEYMWIGFSNGMSGDRGDWVSNYYVGDWVFESYGIAPRIDPRIALGSAPAQKKVGHYTGLIVGTSVTGGALTLTTIFVVTLLVKRRRGSDRGKRFPKGDLMRFEGMPERFRYEDLSVATRTFSEEDSKLGQGGFQSVYRGMLTPSGAGPGVEVAVKKISST